MNTLCATIPKGEQQREGWSHLDLEKCNKETNATK